MTSITQSKFRASLTVLGHAYGAWDVSSGGEFSNNVTVFNPGGGAGQIALAGNTSTGVITLNRTYDLGRDHAEALKLLVNAVKIAGTATVSIVPLDIDGNAYGNANVWRGVLTKVTPPPTDSNSNSAATITVEITPVGDPSPGGR